MVQPPARGLSGASSLISRRLLPPPHRPGPVYTLGGGDPCPIYHRRLLRRRVGQRLGCPVRGSPAHHLRPRPPVRLRCLVGFHSQLGIKSQLTTPYHPQANGAVERFHRRLKDALRARLAGSSSLGYARPSGGTSGGLRRVCCRTCLRLPPLPACAVFVGRRAFTGLIRPATRFFHSLCSGQVSCPSQGPGKCSATTGGRPCLRQVATSVAGSVPGLSRPLPRPGFWAEIFRPGGRRQASGVLG
jgi:hypothetical protein